MAATVKTKKSTLAIGAVDATAISRIHTGIQQVSIGLAVMMTGLAGIWGVATLICAMAQNGGMAGMIKGFLSAITGQ